MNVSRLVVVVVAVLALGIGLLVANGLPAKAPSHISFYPKPRVLDEVKLLNHNKQTLTLDYFQNHWTLVFVGYTYCPDICPTTLSDMADIYPQLQQIETADPIQVLLISVDPKRDSPDRLKEYIGFFNEEFTAASAKHKTLYSLTRNLGLVYSITYAMADSSPDKPDYTVGHSGAIVLVNPEAQVLGRFKPIVELGKPAMADVQQIVADMPLIIDQYAAAKG